jgi:Domain of unknown function (DUF5979)
MIRCTIANKRATVPDGSASRSSYLAVLVVLVGQLMLPGTALAAVSSALITTGTAVAPTGSAPFNGLPANVLPSADTCTAGNNSVYTPGNDPCATDLIIRTNDDVTYNIQYVTTGADTVTIKSVLPTIAGSGSPGTPIADWKALPPQCTPATSSISANGQTLTCVLSVTAAATASLLPQATVRGPTPNGTSFAIPATTVTATGGGNLNANAQTGSTILPLTVSAAPLYDLTKQNSISPGNVSRAWVKGPDGVTDGWVFAFDVAVRAPYGSHGLASLSAAGISLSDLVGSIAFTGSTPANNAALTNAWQSSAQLYNGNGTWPGALSGSSGGCWPNGYLNQAVANSLRDHYLPGGSGGNSVNKISVANNGVCTAAQSGVGQPINVVLKSVNWTNRLYPTQSNDANVLPQPYNNYVSVNQIGVWVPATVFSFLPSGTQVSATNNYTSVTGSSTSSQGTVQNLLQPTVPDASAGGTTNDQVTFSFTQLTAGTTSKYFHDCGTADNANCASINTVGNHVRDGVTTPGQVYNSVPTIGNAGTTPISGAVMCDKIDNTKNILANDIGSGTPVFNVENASTLAKLSAGTDYILEYGTGGLNGIGASWASNADYAMATCEQNQSPVWYTDPSSVPGGLAAITKVRLTYLIPLAPATLYDFSILLQAQGTSPVAGFGFPAGKVWPAGTYFNNWLALTMGSVFTSNNDTYRPDSTGKVWLTGGVAGGADGNPYNAAGLANYTWSDTVNLATARARITKTSTTSTGSTTSAIAGTAVTYALKPSLSSTSSGLPATTMTVTDILPPHTSYLANSASIAPSSEQDGVPAAGYTTLVWQIAATPNVAVTPITFQAIVDGTASNGTLIPNFTLAASPADATPCNASGGAYNQILNTGYVNNNATGAGVTGTLCLRAARNDLSISAPPGFKAFKTVDKSLIEPNGAFTYTLNWISNGTPPNILDLIEVLPYVGDGPANAALNNGGRSPASAYAGSTGLSAAPSAVNGDALATFWYTNAVPATINRDPQVASNGAFAAPGGIWCNAIGGSGSNCPATLAAVTAVRMVSGTAMADSVARNFTLSVVSAGNATGNVYANNFSARADGLANLVASNVVTTTVVTGTISGKVYSDANNDGIAAAAGEPGIDNVRVCLSGYSFGPNGVDNNGAGDDIAVASTCQQTSGGGLYSFTGLLAGKYTLTKNYTVANSPGLAGLLDGKDTAGTQAGTVTNGNGTANDTIAAITLPIGALASAYNFGEVLPAALGGNVYIDADGNGIDTGNAEPAIANVLVTLTGSDDIGNTVTLYACSTTAGTYNFAAGGRVQIGGAAPTCSGGTGLAANASFAGLRPGTYAVTETQPANYVDATPSANPGTGASSAGTAGSNTVTGIFLNPGNAALGYNFGELALATINLTKTVVGAAAPNGWSFTLSSSVAGCTITAPNPATTASGAGGNVSFAKVPLYSSTAPYAACSYAIAEAAQTGWAMNAAASSNLSAIAVTVGGTTNLSVENDQQTGTISVNKTVVGLPSTTPWQFTLSTTTAGCSLPLGLTNPASTPSGASGSAQFAGLPLNSSSSAAACVYAIAETAQAGYNLNTAASTTAGITLTAGTTTTANIENDQLYGSLSVTKSVSGGPAGYSGSFPISVSCLFNRTNVNNISPAATQSASAGTAGPGSVTFGNIPQGATCTISETNLPTPPLSYTWNTPTLTQPTAAIGASPVSASVQNSLTQQFGSLIVTKTVSGAPSGYSGSFPISVACLLAGSPVSGIQPNSPQSVTAGAAGPGSVTFTNIPQGAICSVSEGTLPTNLPTSYAWVAGTPSISQSTTAIGPTPSTADVVNTMVQQVAGLSVVKSVTGGPAGFSGSFEIDVACTLSGNAITVTPASQMVSAGTAGSGTVNFSGIPQGAICTVSEGSMPATPTSYTWAAPTISAPVTIQATGSTATVANMLSQQFGSLIVNKTVSGGPAGYSDSFPITVECSLGGVTVTPLESNSQSVTAGTGSAGSVTFSHIPQGSTCTTSEGALPAAPLSYTFGTPVVTQAPAIAAASVTATVANSLAQQFGSLQVTKTVSGGPASYSDSFLINVACTLAGAAVTPTEGNSQSITAGPGTPGALTFSHLPQGSICTTGEGALPNPPLSYTFGTPTITQAAAIAATQVTATVVNTLTQQMAGLTVTKTVSGGPSGYQDNFTIIVACTLSGNAVSGITPNPSQSIAAGPAGSGSVNFGNIPAGSICTVSEGALPTAPASYTWATPSITQSGPIAVTGSTATVANILSQQFGTLIVTKQLNGGPSGYGSSFPIVASCTLNGVAVAPAEGTTQSASATTGGSGSVTFSQIPQGATCTVSEGSLPAAPIGYTWATPIVTQPTSAITTTASTATVVNALTQLDPPFVLIKSVTGGPAAGVTGTFSFNIDCGSAGQFVQNVVLANATSGSVSITNIPYGSTCTFSEAAPLPTAPNGFIWTTLPPAQTRTIDGSAVSFVNALKASGGGADLSPVAVPSLSKLALFGLVLSLLGASTGRLRRRR